MQTLCIPNTRSTVCIVHQQEYDVYVCVYITYSLESTCCTS